MNVPEDNAGPVEPSGTGWPVPAINPPADSRDEITGLPGLPKWSHVYLFVFACFVIWVALLLALTVFYS